MRYFLVTYIGAANGSVNYGSLGFGVEGFVNKDLIRENIPDIYKDSHAVLNIFEFKSEEDYNTYFMVKEE